MAEGQQVVARDGRLGIPPLQGSAQALTTRREVLPAAVMGPLVAEVWTRVQAHAAPAVCYPRGAPVGAHGPWLARVDGSTVGLPREAAFPYWTDANFPTREQIMDTLPQQETIFPPEIEWKYSNLGLGLAGEIVAAVSGQSYEDYIKH